jgi:hypothetical protein
MIVSHSEISPHSCKRAEVKEASILSFDTCTGSMVVKRAANIGPKFHADKARKSGHRTAAWGLRNEGSNYGMASATPDSSFIRRNETGIFSVSSCDSECNRTAYHAPAKSRCKAYPVSACSLSPFRRGVSPLTNAGTERRSYQTLRLNEGMFIDFDALAEGQR